MTAATGQHIAHEVMRGAVGFVVCVAFVVLALKFHGWRERRAAAKRKGTLRVVDLSGWKPGRATAHRELIRRAASR